MKRTILLMAVCLCFIGKASAQWVVSDPGNLAQGIINTTKQIVQTSTTAKNTLDGFMEAQKIFQQGKKYYDALKAVHDVVKGGIKGVLPVLIIMTVLSLAARLAGYGSVLGGLVGIFIIVMLPIGILTSYVLWKKGKIQVVDKEQK